MKIIKVGGRECFTDLPIDVHFILTLQCNYRCSYCFQYGKGKTPPPPKPFASLTQLRNAVDNVVSLNRPWYNIVLSGGEPTINPYISNLISMLYESLGARLNKITIMTNGSRNVILYKKISDISKEVHIKLHISIHTDHVDMSHILELIETLSRKVTLTFLLLFNPNKRDFVHEIYDILYQYRKKYWFQMSIITIRDGNKFDPRYTPEDFTWHKETQNKFRDLEKMSPQNCLRRGQIDI